jgi:hypothetical protein
MTEPGPKRSQIDQFILNEIESVPHLEALLLFWNTRPRQWSLVEMARALYLSPEQTSLILRDLAQRRLIAIAADQYSYNQEHPHNDVIEMLDQLYRREVVRISTSIHSKPSASVRAFARAFKLTKD